MEAKQTPLIELLERVPKDARLVVEHNQFSSSSYPVGRLCHEAAAAIREALADHTEQPLEMVAEQPAPPPECQTEAEKTAFAFGWWKALEMHRTPAQQQEPFCYHDGHDIVGKEFADHSDVFPLYTAPQPSKPLTDAQIGAVAADIWGSILIAPQSYQAFARAIEAAHGITGETK